MYLRGGSPAPLPTNQVIIATIEGEMLLAIGGESEFGGSG